MVRLLENIIIRNLATIHYNIVLYNHINISIFIFCDGVIKVRTGIILEQSFYFDEK